MPAILCKHMPDTGLVADTDEPRRLPALRALTTPCAEVDLEPESDDDEDGMDLDGSAAEPEDAAPPQTPEEVDAAVAKEYGACCSPRPESGTYRTLAS